MARSWRESPVVGAIALAAIVVAAGLLVLRHRTPTTEDRPRVGQIPERPFFFVCTNPACGQTAQLNPTDYDLDEFQRNGRRLTCPRCSEMSLAPAVVCLNCQRYSPEPTGGAIPAGYKCPFCGKDPLRHVR